MNIAIPFISHVDKQITPEQALKIAEILGLPLELSFLSLTIDETLNLRAFARGISESQPFHWNSVPFNFLAYQETPAAPMPETVPESPLAPMPEDSQKVMQVIEIVATPDATQPLELSEILGIEDEIPEIEEDAEDFFGKLPEVDSSAYRVDAQELPNPEEIANG